MPPPRLKRSNTAGAAPASLDDGEIAINQSDGKLYYHTAAGGVASFASVPSAHKATHATGGSDALSPADIGALTQADADSRYVNVTGDTMSGGLTINAATPLTVTGGRTFLAADSEPYGVGVKYVSSGGAVYFGATDGTSAPGAQISKAGGVALMSFTNAGAASIPGTLMVGGTAVVVSSDPRLSDARSPLSHAHGNLSNEGAIGTASGLPIITTTSGVLTTGTFGTTPGSFCQGSDARLSDARTPAAHKATHATGGSDALTPSAIGAAPTNSPTFTGNVGIGAASTGSKLEVIVDGGQGINCVNNGIAGTVNYAVMGQGSGPAAANTGFFANVYNGGSNYGVRITNPPSSSTNWSIYSDATAQSYFAGNIGIGVSSTAISSGVGLHCAGSTLRVATPRTPASSTATGNTGEICWDASYVYLCVNTNTWRRIAHSTW